MRVIVCGSRDWTDEFQIQHFLRHLASQGGAERFTIVTGGARGADQIAETVARGMGFKTEVHYADWTGKGKAAGHLRNRLMLDLGADMVVAFKHDFSPSMQRGGTENMVRIASEAGVPTHVLPSDPRAAW